MILDTGLVDLDHLTHAFALLVVFHHIAPFKIDERNRQIQKCERFFTSSSIGDLSVFARLNPNEMDIDPGQVLGPDDLEMDGPEPGKKSKAPK